MDSTNNVSNKPILASFFAWAVFGQLLGFAVDNGYFSSAFELSYQYFGAYIPSISRIDKAVFFDVLVAKSYASALILLTPVMFGLLLFVDVEPSVAGVRKNGKERLVISILLIVGSLIFVGGFNFRGPGNIFRESIHWFSFLVSLLTFLSAYCFRAAFCIRFNK